jgi:hypothetical protein
MILVFQAMQTYVVDAFTLHAASGTYPMPDPFMRLNVMLTVRLGLPALAAVSCLRSLAGFGFPLFATPMYNKLGYGKGDTVLACVCIALGCPAYVLPFLCGVSLLTLPPDPSCSGSTENG